MRTPHHPIRTAAGAFALLATVACSGGLYHLPDPPPRDQWHRSDLSPGADEQRSQQNFLAAQDAVLSFVEAMRDQRYSDAYNGLSNETRILLDSLSPTGRGEDVLAQGILQRDGQQFQIDPLDLFVIADLDHIVDEQPGETEAETDRRKEIWAISTTGQVHHLVVIYEGDAWRIHKPQIDITPGAPGRSNDQS